MRSDAVGLTRPAPELGLGPDIFTAAATSSDMRLVQVSIPIGKRDTVIDILDEEGVDYMLTDETGNTGYTAIAYFPLPTAAVEPILGRLREAGLGDDVHAIIIDAETDISRKFEALTQRYARENGGHERIAREEIRTRAKEMAPDFNTYLAMTVISAVVATAGLLIESVTVVVGSMVIAPLIGPAIGTSVGTVIDDADMFRRGMKLQIIGVVAAIASGAAFAWLVKMSYLVPPGTDILSISQISGRLTPDFLSLAVALGAGAAGVLSLSTGVSVAIVGVMIAAALIPPAAGAGIGIAWGSPIVAVSMTVLVLVNVLSINLSGLAVLWYLGYRPKSWFKLEETRKAIFMRAGALVAAILILSVFLGGVTYTSLQNATFEDSIHGEVEDALSAPEYSEVTLLDISVEYASSPFGQSEQITVTVGHPPGGIYPQLADELGNRLRSQIEQDVIVQVRFVEVETVSE